MKYRLMTYFYDWKDFLYISFIFPIEFVEKKTSLRKRKISLIKSLSHSPMGNIICTTRQIRIRSEAEPQPRFAVWVRRKGGNVRPGGGLTVRVLCESEEAISDLMYHIERRYSLRIDVTAMYLSDIDGNPQEAPIPTDFTVEELRAQINPRHPIWFDAINIRRSNNGHSPEESTTLPNISTGNGNGTGNANGGIF
jgi:hypothetical protein